MKENYEQAAAEITFIILKLEVRAKFMGGASACGSKMGRDLEGMY